MYYKNIFNYLFALNDLDTKIKKLYFELKFCLNFLKFYSQSYQIILELYQKYPNDIQIIFELGKDSVTFSNLDKYQEMMEILKQKKVTEKTKWTLYPEFTTVSSKSRSKYLEVREHHSESQIIFKIFHILCSAQSQK